MGGLGKTTLTRNVFNHNKIKTHFNKHIWVHVSQNFDALVLFKKILNTLGGKVDGSREDVLKNLREALKDKTYVLVFDDVWNEDQQKWDDFIKSWLGITSTKGNNIIVTTRNEGVGSLVKTLDMHLLSSLSVEECWSIIKDKASERGSILPNCQDIGISIAKRCQGLPLAANVVGGVLRGKSYDEWLSIEKNWLSGVEGGENYVNKILKLSFHHLPSPSLKKCFAYCSIYPKGAQINKEELIQLWMAEGFLQPSETSDMETVGNQILNILLRNSLLQVVDRKYGEVKHCSMHDLVHDVACTISDVTHYKRHELPNWYNRGCIFAEPSHFTKEEAKWLRTFIYNGGIVDIFSNFKSLHALTLKCACKELPDSLTLMECGFKELPDSIRELIHLRYLNISVTCIRYLPNSIGKLYHMQTIKGYLKKLPSTLKCLLNLRHLHLNDDETELPPQMGLFTSLQTIPCFKVRNKNGHRIVELGNLKNLKGELKIYNLEEVEGEEESKRAYLDQKSGIVRLVLRWGNGRGEIINDGSVLKGLQPHLNIKSLEIDGFQGACFPSWTLKMERLSNLVEIRIERCEKCEEIPAMGHLPRLKSLHLRSLERVKCIGASFYGIEELSSNIEVFKETITVFPTLERLELSDMRELKEWEEVKISNGAQVKAFPCLEYLSMKMCDKLRSAPSQFTSLKELEIKVMESELPLTSICGIKLKTLTRLVIGGIEGLTCLPDWLFHNNQHLSMLDIRDCPKLRELQDGMHNLNSLKNLSILNCKNLESILISGGKLQGLEIRDCPKLRELSGGMHNLNSLEDLYIERCENLESIPYSVNGGKLQGLMTSLRLLTIRKCGLLTIYLGEIKESWAPLLEELGIDAENSDALDSASFKKAVNGILQFGPHSLHKLSLTGKEDWESLPDQLQHLTSLVALTIEGFGIEELPEWIGNLSNLRELNLIGCQKLKHLASEEAMLCLTNLTTLRIKSKRF